MKLKGSDILIECLKENNVDTVFGYPGGAVLNIYDSLFKSEITHVLTSHEQGASHAADGYARATGKVGVCIATSGPGATNLVTGIATAYMDSVPMVAITGQVPTSLLGRDSFQEVDIAGITMPVTKHNYIVRDITKLADIINEAFYIAKSGRPGPVLIDICKDVTGETYDYETKSTRKPLKESYIKHVKLDEEKIAEVANLINSAKQPFIMSGGGVKIADVSSEVSELANKAKIPVATTLMGIGGFSGNDELCTGLVGMHGTKTSNLTVGNTDLFIAIGVRFSDRVISNVKKFATNAKIIQIDIDPAEVGKNLSVHYPLIGDIKEILGKLLHLVEEKELSDWNKKVNQWKETYPLKYADDGKLKPQYVIERLNALTKGEAIITTEVGQNQLWAAQYYKCSYPRQFLTSGGLGTMGYGLGACIGAQFGVPDKKVINVAGDGSFMMNCNELATAVKYKIPIIVILLNNGVLGMVRQWQDLFYDKRYSSTTLERGTDHTALVKAFGAIGIEVNHSSEVDDAILEALKSKDVPVVINCKIDKDEKVFPIVPPGAAITDVLEG